MTLYGMDCPFDQFRSAVLTVFPPSLLPTSSLLTVGDRRRKKKAFILHKHCSALAKLLVFGRHCLSTIWSAVKKVNTIPVVFAINSRKSFKIENVI